MDRITPSLPREKRKIQALNAIAMIGIDYLSENDMEQVMRLVYIDDMTQNEFNTTSDNKWNENKKHCEKILVSLGYKPIDIFKEDVRDKLKIQLAKEFGEKFAKIKAENERRQAMIDQAEKEAIRKSRIEANNAHKLALEKARQNRGLKSIGDINGVLSGVGR